MTKPAVNTSTVRFLLICVLVSMPGQAAVLERRKGNIDTSQEIKGQSTWRAFACMVPFTATDGTSLFMLYGGTANTDVDNPLDAASKGLGDLRIYDPSSQAWYAPSTTNAPSNGPVLPGCGTDASSIWVYDSHYGEANMQSTSVSLLDSTHWSWSSPTQNGQLPVSRFGAAFAYVSSKHAFYMHGGIPLSADSNTADSTPGIANNMDYLDPTALAWSYTSNGPARKYHTICYLSSIESLVLFGGSDQNIASYNDIKVFSVKGGIWQYSVSADGGAPSERVLHSAVCSEDKMYVFGGTHTTSDSPSDSTVWILTVNGGANFTWSKAPVSSSSLDAGPTARAGHSALLYDNSMYIFGGVGSSSRDDSMYKLDLRSWEWSSSNTASAESNGNGGVNTRVLIAAVVSSVLGIICVGIAAFVFYRWNRRRSETQNPQYTPSVDGTLPDGGSELGNKDVPGYNADSAFESHDRVPYVDAGGAPVAAGAIGMHHRRPGGYHQQYEDPEFQFGGSGSTSVHPRRASDIVANNYLPPPHSNPSLGTSVGSCSSPPSPQVWPAAAFGGQDSVAIASPGDNPSPPPVASSTIGHVPSHAAPGNSAAIVSGILASGKLIPAWLREAASRASEEHDNGGDMPQQRPNNSSGPEVQRVSMHNEGVSVYSNSTNDMQSTSAYEPIRYVDVSRTSTEETGLMARRIENGRRDGTADISGNHTCPKRQISDLSELNIDTYTLPDALAFRAASLENIAQPLAPPVPPHMNSLYGELENNGIVIGHAGVNQTLQASPHTNDDNILSPLDRLARLDAWMASDADQTNPSFPRRESGETDDTTSIYVARPVRLSTDEL